MSRYGADQPPTQPTNPCPPHFPQGVRSTRVQSGSLLRAAAPLLPTPPRVCTQHRYCRARVSAARALPNEAAAVTRRRRVLVAATPRRGAARAESADRPSLSLDPSCCLPSPSEHSVLRARPERLPRPARRERSRPHDCSSGRQRGRTRVRRLRPARRGGNNGATRATLARGWASWVAVCLTVSPWFLGGRPHRAGVGRLRHLVGRSLQRAGFRRWATRRPSPGRGMPWRPPRRGVS